MISRAIDNYKLLFPGFYPRIKEFEEQWLKRHEQKPHDNRMQSNAVEPCR